MKVLVTGGAGYIGAHVSDLLEKNGYQVRIFDDFSNGLERRTKSFADIYSGDITDRQAVLKAMDGVDAVIHLAAKKAVGESVSNPLKYYTNNVGGTMNLLAAMSLKKVSKIVFSSRLRSIHQVRRMQLQRAIQLSRSRHMEPPNFSQSS